MKVKGALLRTPSCAALGVGMFLLAACGASIDDIGSPDPQSPSQSSSASPPPPPPPRPVPPPSPSAPSGDEVTGSPAMPMSPPGPGAALPSPLPTTPSPEPSPALPLPAGPGVLLDVDLTQGNAGNGQVVGGAWEDGWRVTKLSGERIVWDLGRPVANGIAEVSFTMKASPISTDPVAKLNWAGLHEHESLSQAIWDGDHFYARVGKMVNRFSRLKAYGRRFDRSEWEQDIGSLSDWVTNDKTVQTVKFEWKDGIAIFHDTKGKTFTCPTRVCNRDIPIDHLRYMFVGSDKWVELGPVGLRFKHVKVTDRGGDPIGPPGKLSTVLELPPKR